MNNQSTPVVYGQPNCTFCTAAVNLLVSHGYTVNYLTVGVDLTKEEYFGRFPGVRSVPMIEFMGDSYNYQELKAKIAS